jgi:hypothetical protein
MGITFNINEKKGFFVSTLVGGISDADLLSAYRSLFEDERFKPGMIEIADMREAQMEAVTSDRLYRLSAMVHRHLEGKCEKFKVAIIAPALLPYGISRAYEVISASSAENVRVFREIDKAFEWVGVDANLIE